MSYLRLLRARILLGSFLISSLLLVKFSAIDLHISRLFFDNTFHLADAGWVRLLHASVGIFICISMLLVMGLYACNTLWKKKWCAVDGRKVIYLFLVLSMGGGLIVNVILKDNFGRAR